MTTRNRISTDTVRPRRNCSSRTYVDTCIRFRSLSSSRATLIEKCLTNIRYYVDAMKWMWYHVVLRNSRFMIITFRVCATPKYEPIRGIDVDADRDNDHNLSPYFPLSLHAKRCNGRTRTPKRRRQFHFHSPSNAALSPRRPSDYVACRSLYIMTCLQRTYDEERLSVFKCLQLQRT